jgi:hypothetical protein
VEHAKSGFPHGFRNHNKLPWILSDSPNHVNREEPSVAAEFLRVLCGFPLRTLRLKGLVLVANQKTLTAKCAKKGRKVCEEIK